MVFSRPKKGFAVSLVVILSILTVYVTTIGPAGGYEVAIYNAYSPIALAAFGFVLVGGLMLIIYSQISNSKIWGVGFSIIIAAYALFYSLPLFRGYVLYGTPLSDSLQHLSVVSTIITEGKLPRQLYPNTQLLFAELTLLTDIPAREFQMPISFVFTTLFTIGCFVSGRRFFSHRAGICILAASVPLVYTGSQLTILPWFYALCMIPLVFLVLQIQSPQRTVVTATLLTLSVVFFHPLTGLFGLVVLGVYSLWKRQRQSSRSASIVVALVSGIVASIWALSAKRVQALLTRTIIGATEGGGIATYASRAGTEHTLSELIINFVILRWGPLLLFIGTAFFIALYLIYQDISRWDITASGMMSIQYFVGGLFGIVLVMAQVLSSSPVRVSQFALFFSIYLVGYGLWLLFKKHPGGKNGRKIRDIASIVVVIVIVVTTLLSFGIAYEDHHQITRTTLEGSDWHLKYHDTNVQTLSLHTAENLQLYLRGYIQGNEIPRVFSRYNNSYQLPANLGYDRNKSISKTLTHKSYLMTKIGDIKRTTKNSRELEEGYSNEDISHLATDRAASKLYSNGEVKIWLARS